MKHRRAMRHRAPRPSHLNDSPAAARRDSEQAFEPAIARQGDASQHQQCRRKTGGIMSTPRSTATGAMTLLTEYDDASGQEVRSLRLEPAADGKAVLLIEIDERKPGIHREVRYEITPAELIAAIRAHGAELPGEQHNR
jgi:hypothetical protein